MRKRIEHLTIAEVRHVEELYNEGLTVIKIAKMYNVKPIRISKILKELNVVLRKGYRSTAIIKRDKEIVQVYTNGKSIGDIATLYNLRRDRVYKIILKKAYKLLIYGSNR